MGKAYTYQSRSFAARVVIDPVKKRKRVQVLAPLYYDAEVSKLKEGDYVSVVLTNKRPKRTESQNRYWWGAYLPEIMAAGKGRGTALETHEDFARKHLTIKEWKNDRGQICYVRKSTAELSVGEFCEFVINVQNDTGIEAPPTESYDLAPLISDKPKKKHESKHRVSAATNKRGNKNIRATRKKRSW